MSIVDINLELYKNNNGQLFLLNSSDELTQEHWYDFEPHLQYLSGNQKLPIYNPELNWANLFYQLPTDEARKEVIDLLNMPGTSEKAQDFEDTFLSRIDRLYHNDRVKLVDIFAKNDLLLGGEIKEYEGSLDKVLAISTNFDSEFDDMTNQEFIDLVTKVYFNPLVLLDHVELKDGQLEYALDESSQEIYTRDIDKDVIEKLHLTPVKYEVSMKILD